MHLCPRVYGYASHGGQMCNAQGRRAYLEAEVVSAGGHFGREKVLILIIICIFHWSWLIRCIFHKYKLSRCVARVRHTPKARSCYEWNVDEVTAIGLSLPNFGSLSHSHGLEEAPVVHQPGPGHLWEVCWPHHWLCHGQWPLHAQFWVSISSPWSRRGTCGPPTCLYADG